MTKKSRDFRVVEIDPTVIDVESKAITSSFQSYNWWIDLVQNESWAYLYEAFDTTEVANIIKIGGNVDTSAGNSADILDGFQTRSWIRSDVEGNQFIFQKLASIVKQLNEQFFNFDISYIDTLQFIRIDENSKGYGKSIDGSYSSTGTKKLSFVVQLSDPEDYEGGTILLHNDAIPVPLPKSKGSVDLFPAYTLREIAPVTKGAYFLLVGTVVGARFK